MNETQKIQWKRIAIEAAAIVASILLAFAIDAWWAEQQDRREESELLSRLHTEFALVRDGIGARGTQNRVQVANAEMFRLLEANRDGDGPVVIHNTLIYEATIAPTVDPATPVLDGLILSWRLDVIRDNDILTAIFNWQVRVKNVSELELGAREFVTSQVIPALAKRGYMGRAFREEKPDGETSILVDDELVGIVSKRARDTDRVLNQLEAMKETATELLSAIEKAQRQ